MYVSIFLNVCCTTHCWVRGWWKSPLAVLWVTYRRKTTEVKPAQIQPVPLLARSLYSEGRVHLQIKRRDKDPGFQTLLTPLKISKFLKPLAVVFLLVDWGSELLLSRRFGLLDGLSWPTLPPLKQTYYKCLYKPRQQWSKEIRWSNTLLRGPSMPQTPDFYHALLQCRALFFLSFSHC